MCDHGMYGGDRDNLVASTGTHSQPLSASVGTDHIVGGLHGGNQGSASSVEHMSNSSRSGRAANIELNVA